MPGHAWACPTERKKLKKFPNGPIRKVNMLKSKFDDIFVPAPLGGHPGSTLKNVTFLDPPPEGPAGGSYVTSSVSLFSYFPPLDFLDFLHQVSLL